MNWLIMFWFNYISSYLTFFKTSSCFQFCKYIYLLWLVTCITPVRCSKMVHNDEVLVTMNTHKVAVIILVVLSFPFALKLVKHFWSNFLLKQESCTKTVTALLLPSITVENWGWYFVRALSVCPTSKHIQRHMRHRI